MAKQDPNKNQQNQQGARQSRPVGNYNPGGQAGESVQGGGQRPADEPGGPFLGRSAMSTKDNSGPTAGNPNPGDPPSGGDKAGQTGTPAAKGK
jgi:hypothetical protein